MNEYILYFCDPFTGSILRRDTLEAANDAAALSRIACGGVGRVPVELWKAGKKIARLEPVSSDPPYRQQSAEIIDLAGIRQKRALALGA